jgi:hypothetical protein
MRYFCLWSIHRAPLIIAAKSFNQAQPESVDEHQPSFRMRSPS